MCGITGVILGNKVRSAGEYERIRDDFCTMLVAAQVRGTDAAGLYVLNENGEHYVHSAAGPAAKLVKSTKFWSVLDKVGPTTVAIVGHTRAATTGSPKVNDNNHPIVDGSLVGVHNGVIYNHQALRRQYGAVAEVDSATILSTLNAKLTEDAVLTTGMIERGMPQVEGSWAIALADTRRTCLFLARNAGSPMQLSHERKRQAFWFASTVDILSKGLGHKVKAMALPQWTVTKLTRKNARTGKMTTKPIQAPKAHRPVVAHGLEDWELSTGLYDADNGSFVHPYSFFDEGRGSAAALRAAQERSV